jgi:hypothetical protein
LLINYQLNFQKIRLPYEFGFICATYAQITS